jgi:membrane fusion protein (multidrug efflux system)
MSKRAIIVPIVVLGMATALFFGIHDHWVSGEGGHGDQRTDDAYVKAYQTPLSTRISGSVKRIGAHDYDTVKSGQLIVELEDSDYQAMLKESQAAVEAAQAEYVENQDAKRTADASIESAEAGIEQAQSAADAARAGIDATQASLGQAQSEFDRQQGLLETKATTKQQFEQAQASRLSFVAGVASRRADLAKAEAAVAGSQAALSSAKRQRATLDAKDRGLLAQIEAKKAAIVVSQVNLGYTKIFSPSDGSLGEFSVHPGQLVGAGQQVVNLVQSGVWVQANFRETQLGHAKQGDRADIRIDALPSKIFHGHILDIAPASGSQFALLPPDNATGNFTKVVQRVPVKIVLDQDPSLPQLRPGFSAEVVIHPLGDVVR